MKSVPSLPLYPEPIPRRKILASAALVAGAAACGPPVQPPTDASTGDTADDASTCASSGIAVGTLDDFGVATWTLVPDARVVVGRDDNGVYAYSAICTHEGCLIGPPDGTGVATCPCHLSNFDENGVPLAGSEARLPLRHYAVTVCENTVYVDRSMVVPSDTRLAV